MRGLVIRLIRCSRGLALVEFAMVAPVLLMLYLGGYVALDALTCNRKVTLAARSMADLTSRYSAVTTSDLSTIAGGATQIMWPYGSSTSITARISQVLVTSSTAATVVWSQGQNITARTTGASMIIPGNLAANGSYLILGEVGYAYTPPASYRGFGSVALQQAIYMVPRISTSVSKS